MKNKIISILIFSLLLNNITFGYVPIAKGDGGSLLTRREAIKYFREMEKYLIDELQDEIDNRVASRCEAIVPEKYKKKDDEERR